MHVLGIVFVIIFIKGLMYLYQGAKAHMPYAIPSSLDFAAEKV